MSQYPLNFAVPATYRREDFIASHCNREAFAFVESWPHWPDFGLILHGPPACGKTHLAALWAAHSGAAPLAAEQIGKQDSTGLLQGYAALWLEHADTVRDETAFFHLLNYLRERNASLLMTAHTAPAAWNIRLPDLRSRLLALPACAIAAPDEALLEAVMRKQFADRQLTVLPEILHYVLARMERSFAAASALVEALDRAALAEQRAITLPLARKVLEESGALL